MAAAAALACISAATDPPEAELERAVAAAVNRHREASGLAPLAWSDAAAEAARSHSRDMAAGRTAFGHDGFEARRELLKSKLGIAKIAENVSRQGGAGPSVADKAVASWLKSPAHRRNIEGPYQLTGVGAASRSDGNIFLTQIFVGPTTR